MFRCDTFFGLSPARQVGNGLNCLIKRMRMVQQTFICLRQPYPLRSSQLIFNSMQRAPSHKHLQMLHAADIGKRNVRFIGR